jgi:hypothetical protein
MTTRAKSHAFGEVRAVTSMASNCRCDRPRVVTRPIPVAGSRARPAMVQDGVDDAGAVEADHHQQPPRHRRRLVPLLLQPAHVHSTSTRRAALAHPAERLTAPLAG